MVQAGISKVGFLPISLSNFSQCGEDPATPFELEHRKYA